MIKLILAWIILALILSIPIWLVLYYTGIRKLNRDYMNDYETLKYLVYNTDITVENYLMIMDKFIEIMRYKCKDKERLDVLKRSFLQRFKIIS